MNSRSLSPIETPDLTIRIPGSRSLTNRALVCAALADGTSRLEGWLHCDDTEAMRECLGRLGVECAEEAGALVVRGSGGRFAIPMHPLDCRASGTTMRFVTACAALVPGRVVLDGTERMRERPMQELADALGALGARVRTAAGHPPVTVIGGTLAGGEARVDSSRSSQFLSALLMVAPLARSDVLLRSDPIVSRPYVDNTIDTMSAFGVNVQVQGEGRFRVAAGQQYRARRHEIEPDASSATYFFAIAAVTGGRVRVEGLNPASSQADVRFVEVLERMGCSVERGNNWLAVRGARYLHGVDVDMNEMPDASLTLSVVACFARGTTRIRNVGHMRHKETDRMAALQSELQKLGAQVKLEADGLEIRPPEHVRPARVETYDDHRIAMSFAVAGLRVPGMVIENPSCVEKTFPDFFDRLDRLSAGS